MKSLLIITRVHPGRPTMLQKCVESVKAQTNDDYTHLILRDDDTVHGYGKLLANQSLATVWPINAEYVMVLDDDDMLVYPNFVEEFVGRIKLNPEIVFFKGEVKGLGILPPEEYWRQPPVRGKIASFCFAVRRDVWIANIEEFGKLLSGGDFCFISACYNNTTEHHWWAELIACTQKGAGKGHDEKTHK
jgi:glycosyltransferase involved in cell wall biosynthesis